MMTYLIYFLLGLFAGRILRIIISCLPENQKIFSFQFCPKCGTKLRFFEMMSGISYLVDGGHCRQCGQLFILHKPIVELLTGILFVLCYVMFDSSLYMLKALIFTSFLIVISFIDYDHSLIYDKVLLPMAILGISLNLFIGGIKLPDMLIAGLLGGSIFLVLALVSKGGFGGGDIKFMASIGLWLGVKYTILCVLLSFIFGGLGAAVLLLLRMKTMKDKFPYGPYIALASFITLLYGDFLVTWYYNWAFQVK